MPSITTSLFILSPVSIRGTPPRKIILSRYGTFCSSSSNPRSQKAFASDHEEYSFTDSTEMQQLILSLSLETTDAMRRERLANIFDVQFSTQSDDTARKFASLFDQVLIEMGGVIQASARVQAMARYNREQEQLQTLFQNTTATSSRSSTTSIDNANTESMASQSNQTAETDYMSEERSVEERQLWAMVDMMVQSKMLAKKKIGDLDRKNEFQ